MRTSSTTANTAGDSDVLNIFVKLLLLQLLVVVDGECHLRFLLFLIEETITNTTGGSDVLIIFTTLLLLLMLLGSHADLRLLWYFQLVTTLD